MENEKKYCDAYLKPLFRMAKELVESFEDRRTGPCRSLAEDWPDNFEQIRENILRLRSFTSRYQESQYDNL
jgi:hypothetical protein